MRSNEIAKIAGVTVRTLRHYHQIGLLAEPSRQANGYRIYDVFHLIRLLRIGQLTELGMRLSDISAALKSEHNIQLTMLDELDFSLKKQIERLQNQRLTIKALREGGGRLEMPAELVASLTFMEAGRATEATRAGREQAVLFGHIFNDAERTAIAALYERLAESGLSQIAGDLGRQYDDLGLDSTEHEISALASAYVEHLGPWLTEFEQVVKGAARRGAGMLLWEHAASTANCQQRMMMEKVSAMMQDAVCEEVGKDPR